jgi:hypothetical protein
VCSNYMIHPFLFCFRIEVIFLSHFFQKYGVLFNFFSSYNNPYFKEIQFQQELTDIQLDIVEDFDNELSNLELKMDNQTLDFNGDLDKLLYDVTLDLDTKLSNQTVQIGLVAKKIDSVNDDLENRFDQKIETLEQKVEKDKVEIINKMSTANTAAWETM